MAVLDTREGYRAYGDWEAAVFDFIMGAYEAGIRHGECWGVGATEHRDVCASCGGTGTVAMKA